MLFRSAVSVLALALAAPAFAADAPLTKADVEAIVKDYIAEHPEDIVTAMRSFQTKQDAQLKQSAVKVIAEKSKEILHDAGSPVGGNPKGNVTLVEFFDYHCGYCKKVNPIVNDLVKSDPELRVVYKELPILSPDSALAARAALAVWRIKPAKYVEYHNALMGTSGKFDEQMLTEQAEKLGISGDRLKKEMDSPEVQDQIKKTQALSLPLGVRGTPAFIIGDTIIPGAAAIDVLKSAIEEARSKGKKQVGS